MAYILPKLEDLSPQGLKSWADQLVGALEQALDEIASAAGTGYQITNNTAPVRALDVAAATLPQLRVFVGTLAEDLQNKNPSLLEP